MQPALSLSEYRGLWLFVMFDLPVDTRETRKQYAQFRKHLIKDGFTMLQFSVYARYCSGEESAEAYRRRVRTALPPGGHVRVLHVTDRQFALMEVFSSRKRKKPEKPTPQLVLF